MTALKGWDQESWAVRDSGTVHACTAVHTHKSYSGKKYSWFTHYNFSLRFHWTQNNQAVVGDVVVQWLNDAGTASQKWSALQWFEPSSVRWSEFPLFIPWLLRQHDTRQGEMRLADEPSKTSNPRVAS